MICPLSAVFCPFYGVTPGMESAEQLRRALAHAHGVVHLASHADVLREPAGGDWAADRAARLKSMYDPYDQSRIICGGFNDWAAGGLPIELLDDVSISARTLAGFNLRGVRPFTFGACNGATGAVQPVESSASLATAARAAGAGAVIASLWPVPDRETQELMAYHTGSSPLPDHASKRYAKLSA